MMELQEIKAELESVGLIFQGVQPGLPEVNLEPLVLFAQRPMGTTKALPVSKFNARAALVRFQK